jgi:branched-subunit amino acid permease
MPSRQGPIAALLLVSFFWWALATLASNEGSQSFHGRRAGSVQLAYAIARSLGSNGIHILGALFTLAALVWLIRVLNERKMWAAGAAHQLKLERHRAIKELNEKEAKSRQPSE